ncbi:MAG TPA: hypothetical protein PL140_01005 [Ferrovaceae bacterium]|nr:hypothetical protein [Ferrovaceae bacterium]HQU05809.1 hypothetical protein [Ferrovaceae bacterium]
MTRTNQHCNPQPLSSIPLDLPKDSFSQDLWVTLNYIHPTHRATLIKMLHEGLSSSLIYHWYLRLSGLSRYDAYLAIRPILKRIDHPLPPLKRTGTPLPEFITNDPPFFPFKTHFTEESLSLNQSSQQT